MSEVKQLTPQQLALYLGCEAEIKPKGYPVIIQPVWPSMLDSFYFQKYEYIKPILRSLSDITEEEANEYIKFRHPNHSIGLMGFSNGKLHYCLPDKIHLARGPYTWFRDFKEFLPTEFAYLLSKHFDIFNWIEQGLALDKN